MNKPVELQLETVPLWLNGSAVTPAASRMGDVYNPATGKSSGACRSATHRRSIPR
jgi:hypothetical protein